MGGNVMFLTSASSSVTIMSVITADDSAPLVVWRQTPLALMIGAVLMLFGFAAPWYMKVSLPGNSSSSIAGAPLVEEGRAMEPEMTEEQLTDAKLLYKIDFVVENDCCLVGKTPLECGIRKKDGAYILSISRSPQTNDMYQHNVRSFNAHEQAAAKVQEWKQVSSRFDIHQWVFQAGDVFTVRCSTAGFIGLRKQPGVYSVEGLQGHLKLGGNRHDRRLFECVVSEGAPIVGRVLNQLQGWTHDGGDLDQATSFTFLQEEKGYPLGGWRRSAGGKATRPLDSAKDKLQAGDVVLIDAFQAFAKLAATTKNFSVASVVPDSQAPRHGRGIDQVRGYAALLVLIIAVAMAKMQVLPLVMGLFTGVVVLCFIQGLIVDEALAGLNWNSAVGTASIAALAITMRKTGIDVAIANSISDWSYTGKRFFVVILGQVLANMFSPSGAGALTAPIAVEVLKRDDVTREHNQEVGILVIMACSMVFCTPFGAAWNGLICKAAGFKKREFALYGIFASCLSVCTLVAWATYKDV